MGRLKHGKKGNDVELTVPVGTQIWRTGDDDAPLVDMDVPGARVTIADGGQGGRGNGRFATPTNRFPRLAEEGGPAVELNLRLELKLLADVGIIGAPNAGKSSLLAAVSAARPRVADYPFTTLEPVLGVVDRGYGSFVMVDIPGLIEGAHLGVGLGHDFLRHVERTRVLVHVIDGTEEDILGEYRKVRAELGLFDPELHSKPEVVAINKTDVPGVMDRCQAVAEALEGTTVHCISAIGRQGLEELLASAERLLESMGRREVATASGPSQVPVLRPTQQARAGPVVEKTDTGYDVSMPAAERIAAMIDSEDWAAKMQFYEQLRKMGVLTALEKAGIEDGDAFRVGKVTWEWD